MTPPTRLSTALDERLDGLPSVPPELYLSAGRARVRSRGRRRGGAVAVVAAAAVLVAGWGLPLGSSPQRAREAEHAPSVSAPTGEQAGSLSSLSVEPGLGAIDAYSTDDIPEWATEYGNHGPASIAPDGRLWIAPEATVVRSIEDPFGTAGPAAGVSHSYAVEVRWQGGDDRFPTDGLVWSFVFQESGDPGTLGELDSPDRWTADFGLWVDDKVADQLGRPSFAERLVHFADDSSDLLVPGADVEIVQQTPHVAVGDRRQHARETAAEVRFRGQTWFVLASGGKGANADKNGNLFYEAYDETGAGASDFAGFLRFTGAGLVRADDAS